MSQSRRAAIALVPLLLLLAGPRAAAQNLVTNPDFDTSVAGWDPSPLVTWDGTRDADGNPSSGSAQAQDGGGIGITCFQIMTQCITAIAPGQAYEFGGKVFIPPGQIAPGNVPVIGGASVAVAWSTLPNCAFDGMHPPLVSPGPTTTATGTWFSSSGVTTTPPGAVSVQVQGVGCHVLGNGTLLVNFDDMFFRTASVAVVPTLDGRGLAALAALLAAAAVLRGRRRKMHSRA